MLYEKDKADLVTNKYTMIKKGLEETFETTENLIKNVENKVLFQYSVT